MVARTRASPACERLQGRFEISALAEPSKTVREAMCARFHIAGEPDWRSLIDAGGLDAVLIASPAGTHVEIVLTALEAGLHVFCEAAGDHARDIDRITRARDSAGKVVRSAT